MKIVRYGTVTFTENDIKVEGWLVDPEPSDPPEATPEQLLLAVAIHWAQEKFKAAMQGETKDLIRQLLAQRKLAPKSRVN